MGWLLAWKLTPYFSPFPVGRALQLLEPADSGLLLPFVALFQVLLRPTKLKPMPWAQQDTGLGCSPSVLQFATHWGCYCFVLYCGVEVLALDGAPFCRCSRSFLPPKFPGTLGGGMGIWKPHRSPQCHWRAMEVVRASSVSVAVWVWVTQGPPWWPMGPAGPAEAPATAAASFPCYHFPQVAVQAVELRKRSLLPRDYSLVEVVHEVQIVVQCTGLWSGAPEQVNDLFCHPGWHMWRGALGTPLPNYSLALTGSAQASLSPGSFAWWHQAQGGFWQPVPHCCSRHAPWAPLGLWLLSFRAEKVFPLCVDVKHSEMGSCTQSRKEALLKNKINKKA